MTDSPLPLILTILTL